MRLKNYFSTISLLFDPSRELSRKQIAAVFLASGAAGFLIGALGHACWQDAVEIAQVTSGIVRYPQGNPVYLYSSKVWTLYIQICAFFLRAGISEAFLSRVLSGLMGALSFQGIALCALAFSKNPILSVFLPAFSLFSGAFRFYYVYPVYLVGSPYTFGGMGLAYGLLTLGFAGLGRFGIAGFLLGMAPAVHVSMAFFLWLFAGACFLWDRTCLQPHLAKAARFFLIGLLAAAGSYVFHRMGTPAEVPPVSAAIQSDYLRIFVKYWDGHRQIPPLNTSAVWTGVIQAGLCLTWLYGRRAADLPKNSLMILRVFFLSLVIGLGGGVALRFVPVDKLPDGLIILMPLRISALAFIGLLPLLAGLWAVYERRSWGRSGLCATLIALAAAAIFFKTASPKNIHAILMISGLCLWILRAAEDQAKKNPKTGKYPADMSRIITLALLAGVFVWQVSSSIAAWARPPGEPLKKTPFFEKVSGREGLVIVAPNIRQGQLMTRRPILLDPCALDFLPYALEAAPMTDLILKTVYGEDLRNPMKAMRPSGSLTGFITWVLWQRRSAQDWQKIKSAFGVTDILTQRSGWKLNLPVILEDEKYRLYEIP